MPQQSPPTKGDRGGDLAVLGGVMPYVAPLIAVRSDIARHLVYITTQVARDGARCAFDAS